MKSKGKVEAAEKRVQPKKTTSSAKEEVKKVPGAVSNVERPQVATPGDPEGDLESPKGPS